MNPQNLPLGMLIMLFVAAVSGTLSFIYAHLFFKMIKYEQNMIYYLEFFLNSAEIKKRMSNNPKAQRYYRITKYLSIVTIITFFAIVMYVSIIPSKIVF